MFNAPHWFAVWLQLLLPQKGEKESINFSRSTETNEKEEENVREPTLDTTYVIQ